MMDVHSTQARPEAKPGQQMQQDDRIATARQADVERCSRPGMGGDEIADPGQEIRRRPVP